MMLTFLELAYMVDVKTVKTPEEVLKELQRILKI